MSRETLLRRASCLKQTIDALEFKAFRILPTRYIRADGTRMLLPFVEYQRTTSKRSIEMRIIQCGSQLSFACALFTAHAKLRLGPRLAACVKTSRGFVVEQLLAHGEDCSGTLCILIQQRFVGDRKNCHPRSTALFW